MFRHLQVYKWRRLSCGGGSNFIDCKLYEMMLYCSRKALIAFRRGSFFETRTARRGHHPSVVFAPFEESNFILDTVFDLKSVDFVPQKGVDTKNVLPHV